MKNLAAITLAALGLVLTMTGEALAWGPGMHIAAGSHVLDNLHMVTPFVAELIGAHRRAFLYGCLSADIFIGKGSTFRPGHSHNWDTGMKLLESVTRPRLMAYAYGYLTHLAADTVAHNYYIPGLLAVSHSSGTAGHVYFEMQADARTHWDHEEARGLFRRPEAGADGLLLSATSQGKWAFKLKKRLMLGGLSLLGRKQMDGSLSLAERILPSLNYEAFLRRMSSLSLAAVIDILNAPTASPVRSLDPIGSRNLKLVKATRVLGRGSVHDLGRHFPPAEELAALPLVETLPPLPRSDRQARTG